MILITTIAVLAQVQATSAAVRYDKPLSDRIQLVLEDASGQSAYYTKEPVRLRMTFKNTGPNPITGHFHADLSTGLAQIQYRKSKGSLAKFICPTAPPPTVKTESGEVFTVDSAPQIGLNIRTLRPGEEM